MTLFKAKILEEEPAPSYFEAQGNKCELHKHTQRIVWGEGNPNAPIFILLDNPGLREDKVGTSFVCGTRETLQLGMHKAGLDVDSVYVSYLLKRRPIRAYDKPLARKLGLIDLNNQLKDKKPKILFGLGNVVLQALFPEKEQVAEVKNYRGKWHNYMGIKTACSYHPLAVRRRPNLLPYFVEDLKIIVEKIGGMSDVKKS